MNFDTFMPLLPVLGTAFGFWAVLKICRFVYRTNRRMKRGQI